MYYYNFDNLEAFTYTSKNTRHVSYVCFTLSTMRYMHNMYSTRCIIKNALLSRYYSSGRMCSTSATLALYLMLSFVQEIFEVASHLSGFAHPQKALCWDWQSSWTKYRNQEWNHLQAGRSCEQLAPVGAVIPPYLRVLTDAMMERKVLASDRCFYGNASDYFWTFSWQHIAKHWKSFCY